MIKFTESIGQMRHRAKRKPARTLRELADEFGVTYQLLDRRLKEADIKPLAVFGIGYTCKNTWYDPATVRAWWRTQQ